MISTVELRKNGQVTIPDAIRKALYLETGDILTINVRNCDCIPQKKTHDPPK